jgi:hypothetical protein
MASSAAPSVSDGGASSISAAPNSSPVPPSINALQVYNETQGDKPIEVKGTVVSDAEGAPWTATISLEKEPWILRATGADKSSAKRLVAEQYLNAFVPDWKVPREKLKQQPAMTERTADQVLYELEQRGECVISHPQIEEGFFIGRVAYKMHKFEARVPVEKDHSICKKQVALKLIILLAKARYELAETYLRYLKPDCFIRGRVMPIEEGVEAEFKGAPDPHGFVDESSGHLGSRMGPSCAMFVLF